MIHQRKIAWLTLACVLVCIYLVLINAFLFPFVFPDGLAEKFVNGRDVEMPIFHVFAFITTAIMITVLVDLLNGNHSVLTAMVAGMLLGVLVALPEHLHLYAMIEVDVVTQFIPVAWTVLTWGVGGLLVSFVQKKALNVRS